SREGEIYGLNPSYATSSDSDRGRSTVLFGACGNGGGSILPTLAERQLPFGLPVVRCAGSDDVGVRLDGRRERAVRLRRTALPHRCRRPMQVGFAHSGPAGIPAPLAIDDAPRPIGRSRLGFCRALDGG